VLLEELNGDGQLDIVVPMQTSSTSPDSNVGASFILSSSAGYEFAGYHDISSARSIVDIKLMQKQTPEAIAFVVVSQDDQVGQWGRDLIQTVSLRVVEGSLEGGFDEIETTMRVSRNSWSNALACCVGQEQRAIGPVGAGGQRSE